jgi:hypothetical protein
MSKFGFKLYPGLFYDQKKGRCVRLFKDNFVLRILQQFYDIDMVFEPFYTGEMWREARVKQRLWGQLESEPRVQGITVPKRKIRSQIFDLSIPDVSFEMFHTFAKYIMDSANYARVVDIIGDDYADIEFGALAPEFWLKFTAEFHASVVVDLISQLEIDLDLSLTGVPLIGFHGERKLDPPLELTSEDFIGVNDDNVHAFVRGLPGRTALIQEVPDICSGCVNGEVDCTIMRVGPPHCPNFYTWLHVQDGNELICVVIWSETKKMATKIARYLLLMDAPCMACNRLRGWKAFKERYSRSVVEFSADEASTFRDVRVFLTSLLRSDLVYADLVHAFRAVDLEREVDLAFRGGNSEVLMFAGNLMMFERSYGLLAPLLDSRASMAGFMSSRFDLGDVSVCGLLEPVEDEIQARGLLLELIFRMAGGTRLTSLVSLFDEYMHWVLTQSMAERPVRTPDDDLVVPLASILMEASGPLKAHEIVARLDREYDLHVSKQDVNRVLWKQFPSNKRENGFWSI